MKFAADFRKIARDALRGKWKTAVLTAFIATLLGAGNLVNSNSIDFDYMTESSPMAASPLSESLLLTAAIILTVWFAATLFIGGACRLGYASFNLKLIDGQKVSCSDLFSQFDRIRVGFGMNILINLFTILWTLLFIVPGIVKSYAYAMAPYILAENPGMTAREAIARSQQIMRGNKSRLFCLGFSFIGWRILSTAPLLLAGFLFELIPGSPDLLLCLIPGVIIALVASLFLHPYEEAAHAAFYRDITQAAPAIENAGANAQP